MKLQFKEQRYQTEAVDAVVDCFAGQPFSDGLTYRIDPGDADARRMELHSGLRNTEIQLDPARLLENIQEIQRAAGL